MLILFKLLFLSDGLGLLIEQAIKWKLNFSPTLMIMYLLFRSSHTSNSTFFWCSPFITPGFFTTALVYLATRNPNHAMFPALLNKSSIEAKNRPNQYRYLGFVDEESIIFCSQWSSLCHTTAIMVLSRNLRPPWTKLQLVACQQLWGPKRMIREQQEGWCNPCTNWY